MRCCKSPFVGTGGCEIERERCCVCRKEVCESGGAMVFGVDFARGLFNSKN